MNAPAPALTSNITRLPTAAAQPVQQLPRKGRFPKAIGRTRDAARARMYAQFDEEKKQREIAELDEAWWQALCYLQSCEIRLRELGKVPTRLHHKWK